MGELLAAVESFAGTRAGLRQLQLLSTLTEAEPLDSRGQVGVGALYEDAQRRGLRREGITSDLEALQDRGWLWFERSVAGIQTVVLKQPGIDAAEEFKAVRNDRRRRSRAIRQAILTWLYDLYLDDKSADEVQYILTTDRCVYFGDYFTTKELARESNWLLVEGYIRGFQSVSGSLKAPTITNLGIAFMEKEETTAAPATRGGDVYNINNHGAWNWAQNSSNFRQSNTLNQEQTEQVSKMLASVLPLIASDLVRVTPETLAEAESVAGEIEAEIYSPSPRPNRIKELAYKFVEFAGTGGIQVGIDAVNAVVQQGISGI